MVARVEYHVYEGYTVEPPDGVIDPAGPPYRGDHTIVSVSVAF